MVKAVKHDRVVSFGVKSAVTIGLLGCTIGLPACQKNTAQKSATPTAPKEVAAGQPLPVPPNSQQFLQPTVAQLQPNQMPTLPIKGLTPATKPESRLSELKPPKNTRDPFSTLAPGIPFVSMPTQQATPKAKAIKAKPIRAKAANPKAKTFKKQRPSFPTFQPTASLPAPMPIATIPAPAIAAPLPVAALPEMPAPLPKISATHLADNVEITGVMQMGGKTMVIAKSSNENSARYLQAGDSLAGGQVYVKSVRVSPMGEPIVVLEQNGVEVTKSVGDAGSRVAALR